MHRLKKNPEIIRVGDIVQINNPECFVRCGYPLSLDDVCEEIYQLYSDKIERFIDEIVKVDENKTPRFTVTRTTQKPYEKIVRKLAYIRMRNKEFGGNERRIFTERRESLKDAEAEVIKIKIVKTGDYVKATGGYGEYEPPYLENQKTHKILYLDVRKQKQSCTKSGFLYAQEYEYYDYDLAIENIHVTKIIDELPTTNN